ncbi:MAG: (d)CMP kinase [Dehalococcoidia bacterium]
MPKPMTIAIDGPGAVGKNTIGILLAKRLGHLFLDTGAMYRAMTWRALQLGIDLNDDEALTEMAADTEIDLMSSASDDGQCPVLVNGRDVSLETRSEEVERGVSLVSKVSGVRQAMVAKQRGLVGKGGVVMAGRDIGTVVLPDAELKIYLSASPEERARRRYLELRERGKQANYDQVLADLRKRDKIDSERVEAPLRPADDARIVNTDDLAVEQVLARIMDIVQAG